MEGKILRREEIVRFAAISRGRVSAHRLRPDHGHRSAMGIAMREGITAAWRRPGPSILMSPDAARVGRVEAAAGSTRAFG